MSTPDQVFINRVPSILCVMMQTHRRCAPDRAAFMEAFFTVSDATAVRT